MKGRVKTKRLALGATLASLVTVLLYLGTVIEVLDLTLCACASLVIVLAVLELGRGFAYSVYATSLVLGLILVPNKFAVGAFAFIALYSILKSNIEALKRMWAWILKLLYFNAVLAAALLLAKLVFMLPGLDTFTLITLAASGNVAFVLFDIALTRLIMLYIYKLRSRLRIDKYVSGMR